MSRTEMPDKNNKIGALFLCLASSSNSSNNDNVASLKPSAHASTPTINPV